MSNDTETSHDISAHPEWEERHRRARKERDDELGQMEVNFKQRSIEKVGLEIDLLKDKRWIGRTVAFFAFVTIVLIWIVVFFVLYKFGNELMLSHSVVVSASILGIIAICAKLVGVMYETPREDKKSATEWANDVAQTVSQYRSGE